MSKGLTTTHTEEQIALSSLRPEKDQARGPSAEPLRERLSQRLSYRATRTLSLHERKRTTRRANRYVFALLLFLLVLVGGIGALPAREAAAQEDPFKDQVNLVREQSLMLQSQWDLAWGGTPIGPNKYESTNNDRMENCGCFLALLSTVMNWEMHRRSLPHYPVPLDDNNGRVGTKWEPNLDFTPVYIDEYLTAGTTPASGDEPDLSNNFGFVDKHQKCSIAITPSAMAKAARPELDFSHYAA